MDNASTNEMSANKILVVDDEELSLQVLKKILEREGLEVHTAESFNMADRLLETYIFDAIFTDIRMPEKDGMTLLKRIKSVQPDTPVIMMTGYPTITTASEAMRLEAYDYLSKPINTKDLIITVKKAVETKKLKDDKRRLEKSNQKYQKNLEQLVLERTAKLRESEERYRKLFKESKDAIYIASKDGRIVDMNQYALDLLGYSREEILNMRASDFYAHPEDRSRFRKDIKAKGFIRNWETTIRTKSGKQLNCLITSTLLAATDGKILGYQGIVRDITSQKNSADKIRAQKEFLEIVLESLTHPFYVIDVKDYTIKMANSAAKLGQLTKSSTCYALTHGSHNPCDDKMHPCPIEKIKKNRMPVTVEHVHYDRKGNASNIEINGYPIFDKTGNLIQIIEYGIDITERKKSEKALRESEAKFRHLFNRSPVMMHSENEKGTTIDVNLKWLEETGYSRDEVIGKKADFFIVSESENEGTAQIQSKASQDDHRRDQQYQYRKKNGEVIDILMDSISSIDPLGRRIILSTTRNITEQKRVQKELNRLKTAIEQSADSVVIADTEGVIRYVNPAFESITGYRMGDVNGQLLEKFLNSQDDATVYNQMLKSVKDGKVWHGHFTSKKKDGTVYIEEASVSPVKDDRNEIANFVAVKRDVTEKRRLESIAEAANLMENIGYIFSGIRHEIGNPVNSTKMALAVLSKNLDSFTRENTREYLERALTEVGRIEYLLKALKNFSLFERPAIQNVQIDSFMEKMLPLVRQDIESKGIEIKTKFSPDAGWVLTDPRALQQIMLNILINAADALGKADFPAILIGTRKIPGWVQIVVKDNGLGMTKQELENLFKPFHTTKVDGTGLGLVIVKKMLSKMNSTIEIESHKGAGTLVTLSVPEGSHEP